MTEDLADEPLSDDPLSDPDVLAYAQLFRPGGPRDSWETPVLEAGVRCGRPLVYPVPTDDLPAPLRHRAAAGGSRYYGALFAFDLDDLGRRRRYEGARFEVTLVDPRTVAVALHGDGGALGLVYGFDQPQAASPVAQYAASAAGTRPGLLRRLCLRPGRARAWITGAQSSVFAWVYEDPSGELLVPRTYAMHALIEIPAELDRLEGELRVHVEVPREDRGVWSYVRASVQNVVRFTEPLSAPRPRSGAAVRLCMAADVSAYSGQTNPAAERTQHRLVTALARARGAAGLDEADVSRQSQGDGQFAVFPPGIDESDVIPRLVCGLRAALADTNRDEDRMRLRVALHRGLVKEADNGWVGNAATAVHRILDSAPVREALREHTDADFVLGVPDVLFHDVIAHSPRPPRPDEFREVIVHLPDKNFLERSWLYVAQPLPRNGSGG
jgi:hypothetical protein